MDARTAPDDPAGASADWRDAVAAVRGWRALACPAPKPGNVQRWARKRSDAQLSVAAALPDHSPAGREAAAALLRERGGAPQPLAVRVPGFIRPSDIAKGRALFFNWARAVRVWSGRLLFFFFALLFVAAGVAVVSEDEALKAGLASGAIAQQEYDDRNARLSFDTRLSDSLIERVADHPAAVRARQAEAIGLGFAGGFMAALAAWLIGVSLRLRPARMLFLRRFNDPEIARDLSMVIANELRPFGHTVTLSDKHIRRRRFAWTGEAVMALGNPALAAWVIVWTPVRLILRLFDKSRFGAALVSSARDYRALARRLRDRIGLNFEVSTTSKEAFIVRTTDAWWQEVAALLMGSCDAVVCDVSDAGEGMAWELERIRREGLARATVFLCREEAEDVGRAALDAAGFSPDTPIRLYARGGWLRDRRAFQDALVGAIAARFG